jgi:hypothetical protein
MSWDLKVTFEPAAMPARFHLRQGGKRLVALSCGDLTVSELEELGRLFAAAPALLAALKPFTERPLFDGWSPDEWNAMIRDARSAIAATMAPEAPADAGRTR